MELKHIMKEMILVKALFVAAVLAIPAYASASEGSESEAAIQAQCQAEAENAPNPDEYLAQCIEEKVQAQKEQAEESKEAS
jgi:hypothetical protein